MTPRERLTKAHIEIMRHPSFCLYSGILMLGETHLGDSSAIGGIPTAATDGVNTWYNEQFMATLNRKEYVAIVLHENIHKALRHMSLWRGLFKENKALANVAADYVVNQIIRDTDPQENFAQLPKNTMQDDKFRGWSAKQVFDHLKQHGQPSSASGFDEHKEDGDKLNEEQLREIERPIEQALREGQILVGKMSGNVPRGITEALTPKVDWRAVLREFVSTIAQGKDVSSWKRVSRRWVAEDAYLPSVVSERVGELVVAIDTSGSIDNTALAAFAAELVGVCESTSPERVRVIWWDTRVHKEQVFEGDYSGLLGLLKPAGGGGTSAACVRKYMQAKRIKPEAVIYMTDGYLDPVPALDCPELWLVTQNKHFTPTAGTMVPMEEG